MIIGVFYFELHIPGMGSLKEKRSVISSLKQRLRNGHNIAVSEVAFQDLHQRCALGISTVCLHQAEADSLYEAVYRQIEGTFPVQIGRAEKTFY